MPLEELTDLGYTVSRRPEGVVPGMDTVWGFDKQWFVNDDGSNEEDIVTKAKNHHAVWTKMGEALEYFSGNYANWANMSAGQKDAANRQAQRGLANLIRHVRNDLTSEGD